MIVCLQEGILNQEDLLLGQISLAKATKPYKDLEILIHLINKKDIKISLINKELKILIRITLAMYLHQI